MQIKDMPCVTVEQVVLLRAAAMNLERELAELKATQPAPTETRTSLDQRMIAAGMIPISELLTKNGLGKFGVHTGVNDLESFEQWLTMRYEEMLSGRVQIELDKNEVVDELYEWYFAHSAAFGEVMANFRVATGRPA